MHTAKMTVGSLLRLRKCLPCDFQSLRALIKKRYEAIPSALLPVYNSGNHLHQRDARAASDAVSTERFISIR
jgi:hypothetical protein